jgi:NADH-quinone oxidoreductase subunit I
MVKETPGFPGFDRDRMWITKEELLTWNPQSDVAKPYPVPGGGRSGGTP